VGFPPKNPRSLIGAVRDLPTEVPPCGMLVKKRCRDAIKQKQGAAEPAPAP